MLQLWFLLFELARAPTSVFDFFFSPAMLLPPFCVHFFSGMIAFIFLAHTHQGSLPHSAEGKIQNLII
jgi:hypothetical protein